VQLTLSILPDTLAICRLDSQARLPEWALAGSFCSVTRTSDELSIVCAQANVPEDITCSRGWRGLKVAGPLDLALTGVLAALATPLAEAGISIFALSTYDTDYVLVREQNLERAVQILSYAGHQVQR
jgi:hypothetical protein